MKNYLSVAVCLILSASLFGQTHIVKLNGTGGAGGSSAWGGITGNLPDQTDLQSALNLKAPNANPIFTGQPTIPDFTLALHSHLNAAGGGNLTEAAITSLVSDLAGKQASGNYITALTGNIVANGPGSAAATIQPGVVTLAMQANMASGSVIYRKTAGSGAPEVQTLATLKADLLLTGTNSGDQIVPVNTVSTTSQWLNAYDNTTGLFTKSRPACADLSNAAATCSSAAYSSLTGTPQLANTVAAVTSNWLRSYDSVTGNFTKSQPAFSDISGSLAHAQLPVLLSGDIPSNAADTSGTAAKATILATARNINGVPFDGSAPITIPANTSSNGNFNLGMGGLAIEIPNEAITGTTLGKLAKLTGAPATAIITSTSDVSGVVGICVAQCGTTGNAVIARAGRNPCTFDGPTTSTDYVQISTTVIGDCHDTGSTAYPTSGGQVLGRVLSTNGSGGSYDMTLHMGTQAAAAGFTPPTGTGVVTVTGGALDGASTTTSGTGSIMRATTTTNGAASAPAFSMTGTPFTGGSSTTTKPLFLAEPNGTTSTNWTTGGTMIGVNAASGFAGNLMDLQLNNAQAFTFRVATAGKPLFVFGSGAGLFVGTSIPLYDNNVDIHASLSTMGLTIKSDGARGIEVTSDGTPGGAHNASNFINSSAGTWQIGSGTGLLQANTAPNVATTTAKTANYTSTAADGLVLFNTTGGAFTYTLSSANAKVGQIYIIKIVATSTNALTISPSSGTIDGAASTTITPTTIKESAIVQFDGTNWWIIASFNGVL